MFQGGKAKTKVPGLSNQINNCFMVEVFKTNVKHQHQADMLIDKIQNIFTNYVVNFDLEDCDKILRVKCTTGLIKCSGLINLVNDLGFHAEVLPDEPVPFKPVSFNIAFYSHSNQLN
jgi:hypothetical protein